jgi:hypothetical protein
MSSESSVRWWLLRWWVRVESDGEQGVLSEGRMHSHLFAGAVFAMSVASLYESLRSDVFPSMRNRWPGADGAMRLMVLQRGSPGGVVCWVCVQVRL